MISDAREHFACGKNGCNVLLQFCFTFLQSIAADPRQADEDCFRQSSMKFYHGRAVLKIYIYEEPKFNSVVGLVFPIDTDVFTYGIKSITKHYSTTLVLILVRIAERAHPQTKADTFQFCSSIPARNKWHYPAQSGSRYSGLEECRSEK